MSLENEKPQRWYCSAMGKCADEMTREEILLAVVELAKENQQLMNNYFQSQKTVGQFMEDMVKMKFNR